MPFAECRYEAEGMNRNINVGLDSPHDRNTEKLEDAENQFRDMPMWRRQTDLKMRAAQAIFGTELCDLA